MLSVIIPTYNEKDNVIPMLTRLRAALAAIPFEVVFVDDSADGTDQVISSCTRQDPRVRLIHRDGRRGLASAVVEGIRAARGDVFCVLDGDLQHPPEAIPRLLQALDDADIAIASRRIPEGGDAGLSPVRRLASYTATLLARALLPAVRRINDPMSGFFLCRKEVVEGVDLRPVGFKILLEVLARGAYRRVAEVPYVFQPRRAGATKLGLNVQVAFLHHLWALRRDRPAATPSRRRSIPRWLVWGLAIRLLLVPLYHPWDLQTWYNMFVDLSRDHSPYETLRELTYSTRSQRGMIEIRDKIFPTTQARFYEYYAYPPLPLVIYYPIAKLYGRFFDLDHQFVIQGAVAAHRIPMEFMLFFKVPLFAADVALALVLWRLAGEEKARTFFLNPFVILVSAAWMIEGLMAVFALGALWLLTRGRHAAAGLLLALGALTKWTPGILWPVAGLWMLHRRTPWRSQAAFHAAFVATLVAGVAPFWEGVLFAARFHALRPGANLSLHILLYVLAQFSRSDVGWYYHVLSPYVGAITLPLALGWAYLVQVRWPMPLATAACLTVIAFLLGSKVVNEPYVFLLLPLLLWEDAERPSETKKFLFKAAYGLPLAFAILNVPVLMFLLPTYLQIVQRDPSYAYGLERALPREWHAVIQAVLAFAFVGLMVYAFRLFAKEVAHDAVPGPAHRPSVYRARPESAHHPVA